MPSDRRCGTCRWWKHMTNSIGICQWMPRVRPEWFSGPPVVWISDNEDGTGCPTWEARDADAE